jgi:hypothetical protein
MHITLPDLFQEVSFASAQHVRVFNLFVENFKIRCPGPDKTSATGIPKDKSAPTEESARGWRRIPSIDSFAKAIRKWAYVLRTGPWQPS